MPGAPEPAGQSYNSPHFDSFFFEELLMRITNFRRLALLLLVAVNVSAIAQPTEAIGDRPRVGLVLGGGGARGAAHIGVLRELERRRIPIDAIAGTSMGAIVGGLYASGMTADELEALVKSIDWADAFIDDPQRQDLSYRRKQDDAAYPANLELGLAGGEVLIPKGLIQGQKLQLILREELLHVSNVTDFDDLPIPFRAVASDIATGEPYVMSRGDLALATRASMSAPGVFSPVVVDGRTLVDGGLVGNVPVDVIRDMDVDVVIAVDVEFPLYKPEELQSALAITEQMLTILIRKETLRQLAGLSEDDILIRPELGEYASTNFDDIVDVIGPGEAAAAEAAGKLAELSLSDADYRSLIAGRPSVASMPETIDFVRVIDDGPLSSEVLAARLKTKPGDPVDTRLLAADLERLYSLQYYQHVGYQLIEEDGETGVEFQTVAKSWGPNFLKFGLSLEDDFEGSTAFNVAARLTATGLNSLGAEWRNDVQLGTNPRFDSELYQPLGFDARYFVAPRVKVEQNNFNGFSGVDTVARYRVSEFEAGLDVGRTLGNWGEFRLGVFRGYGDATVKVGDPMLPNLDFQQGGVLARFGVDTLDAAQIPKSGTRINIEWLMSETAIGADNDFETLHVAADKVWSWGNNDKNTINFGLEYSTTFDSPNQVQDYFTLGGFLRLSGMGRGEISGPHIALTRLVYYRELGVDKGMFDMPFYVGGSLESGNAWQSRSDMSFDATIFNGSIFAGVDTYLGQLFLGAGFSEDGDSSFYLFFGNPRPLKR